MVGRMAAHDAMDYAKLKILSSNYFAILRKGTETSFHRQNVKTPRQADNLLVVSWVILTTERTWQGQSERMNS